MISPNLRRKIADELGLMQGDYYGKMNEPDFLSRLYDLRSMHSRDPRYQNAYGDIYQHMVMNTDWDDGWVFNDPRFNLMHCDDEIFLKFLSETLHPLVVVSTDHERKMLELYNRVLSEDGYELLQKGEIQGRPLYEGVKKLLGNAQLLVHAQDVKKHLSSSYVDQKISLMNESVEKDTSLAIGTAKELVETVCKSILKQKSISVDKEWDVAKLLKETTNALNFRPQNADEPAKAEKSIKQILGGISSAIQGVTELRNSYGSGHGKEAAFVGLEPKFSRLIVGLVSSVAIFYLSTNGEEAELIE